MSSRYWRRLQNRKYRIIAATIVIVCYLLSPIRQFRGSTLAKRQILHSLNISEENATQDIDALRQWIKSKNGSKPLCAEQTLKIFRRRGHEERRIHAFSYQSVEQDYMPPITWIDFVIARKKILTKYSYSYDIMPDRFESENPYLIIMVLSVARHLRTAIRQTYGSVTHGGKWPGSNVPLNAKLIFLFGRTRSEKEQAILHKESVAHGDILQGNFVDDYRNLTLKVLMGLNYVLTNYPSTQFVLKADEDTFTDVDILVRLLKKLQPSNSVLGHIYLSSGVYRVGKWAISESDYPFKLYPRYASGNTYVMSMDLGRCVVLNAKYFKYINIEDAFITGIICIACKCKQYNVDGITNWFEQAPSALDFMKGSKISATRVTDEIKYKIWKALTERYHA